MPGVKRQLAETDVAASDGIHPSRRRRLDASEGNAQLAQTYNDLADEAPAVRLRAAGQLCKALAVKSSDQARRISDAIARLIKGLCSGRKAARLGFSVALSEVLRIAFDLWLKDGEAVLDLATVTKEVSRSTQPEGRVVGQELREHLLGRRFALQAILRSDVALHEDVPDAQWKVFAAAIANLAKQKEWLRTECGALLYEYLECPEGSRMTSVRVQAILESWREAGLLDTAEGVALWLAISDHWKDTLPKGVWHKKDPFASNDLPRLRKVLLGSVIEDDTGASAGKRTKSGARQSQPNFAWRAILTRLCSRNEYSHFAKFWQEVIGRGFFAASTSAERKAFGLQIVSLALTLAPSSCLAAILDSIVLQTLLVQRAEASRTLFEAAKQVLDAIIARAKLEPETIPGLLQSLLSHAVFDQQTKTKTIEALVLRVDRAALDDMTTRLRDVALRPAHESDHQADVRRRAYADIAVNILRAHRNSIKLNTSDPAEWLQNIIYLFVDVGYCNLGEAASPAISDAVRSAYRARLNTTLTLVLDLAPSDATTVFACLVKTLKAAKKSLHVPLDKACQEALKSAEQARKTAAAKARGDGEEAATAQAFELLYDLCMLQVYGREPDSLEALADLQASFDAWQAGTESATGLVELLLSFVSKPSALLRKLAEQVFSTFAGALDADGLQSLLDILQQKESLSGQQELFQQHDDEVNGGAAEGEMDDDDVMDVEDASDVELVNGEEAGGSDEDSSDDGDANEDDSSDVGEGAAGEDEEAAFDRKLADALGTAAADADESDDDGSDMNDEQMLALEPHLTTIFKERAKLAGQKQENKDARENIVNFKNRVLDLLAIYVKSQYANVLALDIILPLTGLIRTTSSKPTAEKAFAVTRQYFEACNKHKALPRPEDEEACFEILKALHEEMRVGGSKLHANACSRSSLFLSKVLVGLDQACYKRIAEMYAVLQGEWYGDPKSRVQGSVFTEWTSWSLATRKVER